MTTLLLILSLLPIIYQDFKDREIHIFFLLAFILISTLNSFYKLDTNAFLENFIVSISFFIFLFITLVLYFSIKQKKLTWIVDEQIGLGDLLFWVGLMFQFCFTQLIAFFIGSSILILLIYFKRKDTIPLAGMQSVFLILVLIIDYFFNYNRFTNFIPY